MEVRVLSWALRNRGFRTISESSFFCSWLWLLVTGNVPLADGSGENVWGRQQIRSRFDHLRWIQLADCNGSEMTFCPSPDQDRLETRALVCLSPCQVAGAEIDDPANQSPPNSMTLQTTGTWHKAADDNGWPSGGIGRRIGLKIRGSERSVGVQVPSRPLDTNFGQQ